jgi:hypothetical protein
VVVNLIAHDRMVGAQQLQPAHVAQALVHGRRGLDVRTQKA